MPTDSEATPVERQEPERMLSGGCVFPAEVVAIGERLHTQDNRITKNPIFGVQQKRRIYGLDADYTDNFVWQDPKDMEHPPSERPRKGWRKIGYIDVWEFVTACLTEAGCQEFIRVNGHNLHEPRIYAYGGWRNAEWQTMRAHFKALATSTDSAVKEQAHAD